MDMLVETRQDQKGEDRDELSIFYARAFAVVFSFDSFLLNDFFIANRTRRDAAQRLSRITT